LQPSITI